MLAVLPADVPADVFTAPLTKQLQGPGSSYLRGTTGTLDEKMSSSDEELSAGGADLSTGGGTHGYLPLALLQHQRGMRYVVFSLQGAWHAAEGGEQGVRCLRAALIHPLPACVFLECGVLNGVASPLCSPRVLLWNAGHVQALARNHTRAMWPRAFLRSLSHIIRRARYQARCSVPPTCLAVTTSGSCNVRVTECGGHLLIMKRKVIFFRSNASAGFVRVAVVDDSVCRCCPAQQQP
jgi:hypothetical protein